MKTGLCTFLFSLLGFVVVVEPVHACGETLFRTGSSMRQHMQSARAPARILILAEAGATVDRDELYAGLRRAGHTVKEVEDANALATALDSDDFDLVLAHQRELPEVLAQIDDADAKHQDERSVRRPDLIPVLAKGQRELSPFKVCINEGAEIGTFLRAIAKVMRDTR